VSEAVPFFVIKSLKSLFFVKFMFIDFCFFARVERRDESMSSAVRRDDVNERMRYLQQ
jgi:hypothetical protein